MNEEWRKAKEKLNEQRELLESGISNCMKQAQVMDRAKVTATEVDELLRDINAAKESDMETVETKTEVL